MKDDTMKKVHAVLDGWAAVNNQPLEFVPMGEEWLARKGTFSGTGMTKQEARDALDRMIWMAFSPPGAEWIWNGT